MIKKSILAGMLIGLGDVTYVSQENKALGAFLFSLGLIAIIKNRLFLYTGKIGFLAFSPKTYSTMLVSNMAGTVIPIIFKAFADENFSQKIKALAYAKFDKTALQLLLLGILCGMCMHVAVVSKNMIITSLCVMTFILSGFEHCIADFPYFLYNIRSGILVSLVKIIAIVIGNSLGAVIINILIFDKRKESKYELLKNKFYGHS